MAFLKTYKYYFLAALFALYSIAVVHITSVYTKSAYLKQENTELQIVQQKKEQAEQKAKESDRKVAQLKAQLATKQKVITKEVVREIEKPVYNECHTTDDGVRLIEQSIDNANSAIQ